MDHSRRPKNNWRVLCALAVSRPTRHATVPGGGGDDDASISKDGDAHTGRRGHAFRLPGERSRFRKGARWADGVKHMTTETDTNATLPPERLLRLAEVRHQVGLGKSMIYAMIGEGRFPRPYKITAAAARWSEREVDSWIEAVVRDIGTT